MKWNNSDNKCLKIKVTLHESELEFSISPKSTGKYLFDLVCSTIGLRETWYFGLQFYIFLPNGRMRLSHWLKLDKKIINQKPENVSKSLCFFFHTKFYPEDVEQELIQATTRHLFYLSVKATILNRSESNMNGNLSGDLCPSLDIAITLASLASQAEYGDFCEDELSDTEELTYLPRRILRLIPAQLWTQIQSTQGVTQKFRDCYKSHKGMNRDKAELQYLKVAQLHHLFGVDFFPIVCVRMKCPRTFNLARYLTRNELARWHNLDKHHTNAWLGVTAAGLQLYGKCQRDPPQQTFPWNIIKNVSYRERKFTIKLTNPWRGPTKPSSSHNAMGVTSNSLGVCSNEISWQIMSSQRPHHSSRSPTGRSPLINPCGQNATNLNVGSSAGGSGTSAASLPSTPISARLVPSIPPIATNVLDAAINLASSPRSARYDPCDLPTQLTNSVAYSKSRGKVFELGSRCIPGLTTKSSRYCTNENALGSSCLTGRSQIVDNINNNLIINSSSTRNLFHTSPSSSSNPFVSVVEVWLADPSQAKTVMSMCAGNHSLFMRRRQPDSIEVQQMRAQAREERARREVERARLAKARAEKAEAIEAKLALEARCAQLEEALRHHQKLQRTYNTDKCGLVSKDRSDTFISDSPQSYVSQRGRRLPHEYTNKVAFTSTAEESHINQESGASDLSAHPVVVDDQKSDSNIPEDADKTTSDTVNQGQSDVYFDDYPYYPPEELPEDGNLLQSGKSWDNVQQKQHKLPYVCPTVPDIHVGSMRNFHYPPERQVDAGSVSVPVTPRLRRTSTRGRPVGHYFPQSKMHSSGSNILLPDCDRFQRIIPPTQSNQKISSCTSYIPASIATFCQYWPCELGVKPIWSAESCLACELPNRPPDHSCFRETNAVFPSFVSAPGSLPALHNNMALYRPGKVGICDSSYNSHNPWGHPFRSVRPQSSNLFHVCPPHPHPYFSNGSQVVHPVPCNILKHPQSLFHKWHNPQSVCDYGDSVSLSSPKQFTHPSSSLAAILSPKVTQRWQHPHRQAQFRGMRARSLRRRQSQNKHARPPDLIHIPLMERSTSHVQLPSHLNACENLDQVAASTPRPCPSDRAYHGYSLQHIPGPTPQSNYCDPVSGFEYPPISHSNLISRTNCYPNIGKEYFRRAASLGVSAWNVDPLSTTIPPYKHISHTGEHSDDHEFNFHKFDLPTSQLNYLSHQLQAERAHFAFLQTQFSRQLSDTWAYLKATRGRPADRFYDLGGNNNLGNPVYSELRHDPAGASDGASTGGGVCNMGTSGAYDGLDRLQSAMMDQATSPEHPLYEVCEGFVEENPLGRMANLPRRLERPVAPVKLDLRSPLQQHAYANNIYADTDGVNYWPSHFVPGPAVATDAHSPQIF